MLASHPQVGQRFARSTAASDGLGFALALARATVATRPRSVRRLALARTMVGRARAVENITKWRARRRGSRVNARGEAVRRMKMDHNRRIYSLGRWSVQYIAFVTG